MILLLERIFFNLLRFNPGEDVQLNENELHLAPRSVSLSQVKVGCEKE